MSNIVRAKVTIRGTRALVQHQFGPDSIPLEKGEKTGVAGNDPEEWKKTCMVMEDGRLYLPGNYVFGCLKNGATHTKKGRGTLQNPLISTLQVEDEVVYINRRKPEDSKLTQQRVLAPADPEIVTFIYVATVRNPATKGRNVRYRLTTRAGWKCSFTISWDKTIIARPQMKAIVIDSGRLGGLGDGLKVGCGRFEILTYEELTEGKDDEQEQEAVPEDNGERRRKRERV